MIRNGPHGYSGKQEKTGIYPPKHEKLGPRGSKHDGIPSPRGKPEQKPHVNGYNNGHGHKPVKQPPNSMVHHHGLHSKLSTHRLRDLSLTPPEYYIDPQKLLSDFVEEEVSFAGRIENFPAHEDVTNRTNILRTIDKGKKRGMVSWGRTADNKALISINVMNIKIMRAKNEELLLRVSTHQIAAICYIKDDRQHILAMKYGDPKLGCQLAVMYCDSKTISEEICALVSQCFQLVYTDATMDFIDKEFETAIGEDKIHRSRTDSNSSVFEPTIFGSRPTRGVTQRYAFMSASSNGSAYSSTIYRSLPGRKGTGTSTSDASSWSAAELLQDYLNKLHKKLSSQELKTFAQLLTTRHTNLTFTQFCDKVFELFGENRKNLMTGLWPFISERDHNSFERYLERKGIAPYDDSGYWSLPSSASLGSGLIEDGPIIVHQRDSLHYEDTSQNKRSISTHSDPGPGNAPAYIRFFDNIHYTDPFITIP